MIRFVLGWSDYPKQQPHNQNHRPEKKLNSYQFSGQVLGIKRDNDNKKYQNNNKLFIQGQ